MEADILKKKKSAVDMTSPSHCKINFGGGGAAQERTLAFCVNGKQASYHWATSLDLFIK